MVTGVLGDEGAIELLMAGAKDYVPKTNLVRLPAAIAIIDITEHKQTEAALRASEAQLSNALQIARAGH